VLFVLLLCESALGKDVVTDEGDTGVGDSEHEPHAAHSVLYMPLILTIGVILYYILSRKIHWLPYTAVMFLVGVIVGLLPEEFYRIIEDKTNVAHMYNTSQAWQNIDSEVLLLVFLPGLIFKDALSQNPFLFAKGFGQLFIFAFPMVLAGTFLIACVPYYIFITYEWSFFLCLTFGSILSATDPVAVAALLEEVGAPPRLKTHIAGESLLNDGAAIVFFSIFSELFLSELGIPGVGEVIGGAEGVKIFCKKALGGSAIGFVFGGAIVFLLFLLNRRYSREENIVQVLAVFSMVYLNYYVADEVFRTSGVIATLCAGLFVKFFGRGEINDIRLMDDFFSIIEHILNTIIFSLGGLVWGEFLYKNIESGYVSWTDLGNLIILYVLLHVIRGFLFASCYPITANIGLGTNWRETSFQIYGGLRGAVGIALAIALDNEVKRLENDENRDVEKEYENVSKLYFMVGGIAFLTLFINGATAGPLLKRLRLVEHSEGRQKIIDAYRCQMRETTILSCVKYLTHERFASVDFSVVQENIPFLQDLTLDQLVDAVQKVKETTDPNTYRPPYLENVLLALKVQDSEIEQYDILLETPQQYTKNRRMQKQNAMRMLRHRSSMRLMMKSDQLSTKELRLLFISMLKAQHEILINEGLLLSENGLAIALNQSLELATTDVTHDMNLNDLKHAKDSYEMISKVTRNTDKIKDFFRCGQKRSDGQNQNRSSILLEFAFTTSHERAQHFFIEQLGDSDKQLTEAAKIVLAESKEEVEEITNDLTCDKLKKIHTEVSTRKFCNALLNQGIVYVEELVKNGLLKESEAEEIVHELSHYQAITVARKVELLESEASSEVEYSV